MLCNLKPRKLRSFDFYFDIKRFYPYVYNITGTYDAYVKYGSFFSYSESPRSSIFRRDHVKVTDLDSMISMMRYFLLVYRI